MTEQRACTTAVVLMASLVVGGMCLLPAAADAQPTPASGFDLRPVGPVCDGQWHRVKAANPLSDYGDYDSLVGVSALSPTSAWTVGITDDFDVPPYGYRTLSEHWNGRGWSQVDMPNSTKTIWDQLGGVAALAPDDVWAVGSEGTSPYGSLIEHWDGTAWAIVDDGTPNTYLTSVSGLGPDDVWAAGSTSYVGNGLIDHWDGVSWTRTVLPQTMNFRAIHELAPNDVWAVGQKPTAQYLDLTVAMHWDGANWTQYPTPSPLKVHSDDENWLTSIAAVSSTDIWASGVARDPDYGIRDRPFMLHWDGSRWSLVPTPDPGGATADTALEAVVAVATDDVWAVGRVGLEPDWTTFTIHWGGTSWTQLPSSTPGELLSAAPDGAGGLWAVGDRDATTYTGIATLAEHLCPA